MYLRLLSIFPGSNELTSKYREISRDPVGHIEWFSFADKTGFEVTHIQRNCQDNVVTSISYLLLLQMPSTVMAICSDSDDQLWAPYMWDRHRNHRNMGFRLQNAGDFA